MLQRVFLWLSLAVLVLLASCEHQPTVRPVTEVPEGVDTSNACHPDTVYFVNEILPLLKSNCAGAGCHDANSRQDGVQLDNYNSVISTADVRPGDPNGSDLYEVIMETDPDKRMPPPPATSLSNEQKEKIRKWIAQGARNNYCNSSCDTTLFTYSGQISKILATNCISCHSTGNIILNTYSGVKARVDDGRLRGAIEHLSGFQTMPPGSKLSECNRIVIRKWIEAGAPDN